MSFLTPLYLLGLAAISAPIIFHLIRRTPRGQTLFSSLMFLSPSPPRLTRRSRIDNWLLLLLRALALALIALAFARPFRRHDDVLLLEGAQGRRVAIVVDTSASMRRAGVWDDAQKIIKEALDELGPRDQIALFSFDDTVSPLFGFSDAASMSKSQQIASINAQLSALTPGWGTSNIDEALVQIAESMEGLRDRDESSVDSRLQIILVSDFQRGSSIEGLQHYEWPNQVKLDVRIAEAKRPGNAGLHLIADREAGNAKERRLRVTNSGDSKVERFSVGWKGESPVHVYVPPGKQRVVKIPERVDPKATELILKGDQELFDNTLYFAPIEQQHIDLVYVGDDDERDSGGMLYYLQRVFFETPRRLVKIRQVKRDASLEPLVWPQTKMVILTLPPSEQQIRQLKSFIGKGGHVLSVLSSTESAAGLSSLTELKFNCEEAEVSEYQLLGSIDFKHPVFAPLLAVNFTDFTQPHFWHYRRLTWDSQLDEKIRVAARFDNDDPALIEIRAKKGGTVLALAAGWNPDDSQLALSKKFLPLMATTLQYAAGTPRGAVQYKVGEAVALPSSLGKDPRIATPQQQQIALLKDAPAFTETSEVGLYELSHGGQKRRFAVNVAAEESDTVAMDVGVVEQRGVRTGRHLTHDEELKRARQKRDKDLERSQQWWRWIIFAAIGVLVLETGLAGRVVRKNQLIQDTEG